MALVLDGSGSITGLSAGGLPDGSVTASDLAAGLALPSPSTSGNVLTSNGSAWTSSTPASPAGGATNTGLSSSNITLTSSSNKIQNIISTSTMYYTLPDATTVSTKGGPIFQTFNQGPATNYVKDNGGFIVGSANNSSMYLIDNSTAAGLWAVNGTVGTAKAGQATTFTSDTVVNRSTCIQSLSATAFIITYQKSSDSTFYAVVGTIGASNAITMGTPVQVSATTTFKQSSAVIGLSNTAAMCLMVGTTNITAIPLVISGTTITVGSSTTFSSAVSSSAYLMSAQKVTSTTLAVRAYNTTNANSYGIWMLGHNGSSAPTVGTPITQSVLTGYAGTGGIGLVNSTTLIDTYAAVTTGNMNARTITISGTSLSANANTQIVASSDFGNFMGLTNNGTIALYQYIYAGSGAYSGLVSINISGTSVSLNTLSPTAGTTYGVVVWNNDGWYQNNFNPWYMDSTTTGYVVGTNGWVKATANATTGLMVPNTSITLSTPGLSVLNSNTVLGVWLSSSLVVYIPSTSSTTVQAYTPTSIWG